MNDSYRILVAEDNLVNQAVIKGMLEFAGYRVDTVQNGVEAIQALENLHYDLVIMDCLMPVLDGFAATRQIRNSKSGLFDPQIPVLATTALTTELDRDRGLEAGMTEYITKPIKAPFLFAQISRCLEGNQDAKKKDWQIPDQQAETLGYDASTDSQELLIDTIAALLGPDVVRWQDELKALSAAGDSGELGKLAHEIRGTADIIDEPVISGLAKRLERSGKHGQAELSLELAARLVEKLQYLEHKIK
jgi:two-component system sensor histidine kinase/response regulator